MAEVVFVSGEDGDWIGMYVDGLLVDEGHSLAECQVAEALGATVEQIEVNQEWLEDNGLPIQLSKVREQKQAEVGDEPTRNKTEGPTE